MWSMNSLKKSIALTQLKTMVFHHGSCRILSEAFCATSGLPVIGEQGMPRPAWIVFAGIGECTGWLKPD